MLRTLITDLHAAGIDRITLDPVAGKIRWTTAQPVPDALRARVASLKPDLLALAGDAPLTATPEEWAVLASPPRPPRPTHVPLDTPEGMAQYRADVEAAIRYAVAVNDATSWRYVFEQRARVASFEVLYSDIDGMVSDAKRQADGYEPDDRARVWIPRIDLWPIDAAIVEWRADKAA